MLLGRNVAFARLLIGLCAGDVRYHAHRARQRLSCQTPSKLDADAVALIDSLYDKAGRLHGAVVTFGTVRHYVKKDFVRRLLVLIPEKERVSPQVRAILGRQQLQPPPKVC